MRATSFRASLAALAVFGLVSAPACKDKKDDASDAKDDEKEPEKKEAETEGTLAVAQGEGKVEGPVPPETSMVFFSVEGALVPMACFDKDSGQLKSGDACLAMVKEGDDVRLKSHDTEYGRKAGARVEPQCLAGSGKKVGISVDDIGSGADFRYAAWPPAGINTVTEVDPGSTEPDALLLGDDEVEKLRAAMGGVSGEMSAHQVAEIDVDNNDKKDKLYSVYIPHPRISGEYSWSGAILATDGDLGKLEVIEKSKTKRDVFEVRGWLNLDGKGANELWMRLVFEEGGGDRVVRVDGGKVEPLGNWSCGAAK